MNKFCVHCGSKLEELVVFCGSCGQAVEKINAAEVSLESSVVGPESAMSDRIRENLKAYKKHRTVTCLECGYNGLMGVTKETLAGMGFWTGLILISVTVTFIFGIGGFGFCVLLGAFLGIMSKAKVMCPNCNRELGPV